MTLEDLIAPFMSNPGVFPATLGTYFPQTIELPDELHLYLGKLWMDSEYAKHEEIGGNLIWVADDEPVVTAEVERGRVRSRSISDLRSVSTRQRGSDPTSFTRTRTPGAAPRHTSIWTVVKPEDITLGTEGNSVSIPPRRNRGAVGDFHTHPSTPGGRNQAQCGYQPPSLEDLMGMQNQEGFAKDIFVSFVVVHTSELYAMVYMRGVSHFDTVAVFEKIKLSLDSKAKRIMFPSDAAEEKYMDAWRKNIMNPDFKRNLDKEVYLATDYGERFAREIKVHLEQACVACNIGLYRGAIADSLRKV
ncbi:MAG TPA: hypothetical protein VMU81_22450 [Acetobacteraceae bacterium]|jgi:hypothetical protein|nr:hypothetical protein [Acetobacteraceae bacterium]